MRNILIQSGMGANFYIRKSLVNAFQTAGYNVFYWNAEGKSAFDIFTEFPPDLFIGSTWQLDRALIKNLSIYKPKTILYSDIYGDVQKSLDLNKYPVGIATDEQKDNVEKLLSKIDISLISNHSSEAVKFTHNGWAEAFGIQVHSVLVSADTTQYFPQKVDPYYQVQLAYVGGYWNFKGRNLDQYILPFCYPNTKWNIRLFGNGWNTVNTLGQISNSEAAKHYTNATIIPHVVEPHCSDLWSDIPLRYMEVPACGGFGISCPCVGIREIFTEDELVVADNPADFQEKIVHYLNNPELTLPFRQKAREKVLSAHTSTHRINQLLDIVNKKNNYK